MPAVLLPTAIFAATVTTITVTKRRIEYIVASGGMFFSISPVSLSQKAEIPSKLRFVTKQTNQTNYLSRVSRVLKQNIQQRAKHIQQSIPPKQNISTTTITVTKRSVESIVASGGMFFCFSPVSLSQKAEIPSKLRFVTKQTNQAN
jgi:hypothetical protein